MLERLLSRLERQRAVGPRHWIARCPCPGHANGDAGPSLDIRQAADGRVLIYCRSAGHRYQDVLAALHIQSSQPVYVAPAKDEWEEARRLALDMARHQGWLEPESVELRAWRQRIADLHASAERLGPDDPSAWWMLWAAAVLEHEFRLMDVASDPTA